MLAAIFATLLVVGPAGSPPVLESPEAQAHLETALDSYAAGDYDTTVAELEAAYAIEPSPKLLAAMGKAERKRGNCEQAIALLERFLDTQPSDDGRLAAQGHIDACREQLDAAAVPPVDSEPPRVELDPEPEPELTPDPAPPPKPVPTEAARPWHRDPLGGALVGVGAVAIGTAIGLLAGSQVLDASADDLDHAAFRDQIDRAITMERASIGLFAVGGTLTIAGTIRYVLVARRSSRRSRAALGIDPRGGISVTGRF